MKYVKKTLSIALMLTVAVTFMPLMDQAHAATKKPAKPEILEALAIENSVTVEWGKAKNAKKYQVAIQSAKKKWVKYKTVKKTAKNKKKFTKKNKYKVVAKGKKYVVYQYIYTYSSKKTISSRSYTWKNLKCCTKYTFAVRSVNGKKYSAWATVKKVTEDIPEEYIDNITNTPGAEVPITVGDVTNTLIIGQETTYNTSTWFSSTITGLPTEPRALTIKPTEVFTDSGESDYGPYYSLSVTGTINGLKGYYGEAFDSSHCAYGFQNGACETWERDSYGIEIMNSGMNCRTVNVTKPDIKVYWTLDGTEPKPGQADLTVAGSEYPLGTLDRKREYAPLPDTIKIRGTVSNGDSVDIFKESTAVYINSCIWLKVYDGDTFVGEYYSLRAHEQFWPY